jgi:NAD(P)-dependent dehydrogenase (short-subunit alcohol dehydrogenase family)
MFASPILQGQTAIVTGGGTGIGLSIARALGRLGATVALACRHADHLTAGADALRADGSQVLTVTVDVRDPAGVDAMVAEIVRATGRIDILINNAAGNFVCRAEDLSPNGWNAVIGIVLNGSFYCSRAVGRHLIERGGGGSIVSILANYAWTGSAGTIHSASAKAGVMAMTQTLAVEWAPQDPRECHAPGRRISGRSANCVAAAETLTESVLPKRWGRDETPTVSFLVSPHASASRVKSYGGWWPMASAALHFLFCRASGIEALASELGGQHDQWPDCRRPSLPRT